MAMLPYSEICRVIAEAIDNAPEYLYRRNKLNEHGTQWEVFRIGDPEDGVLTAFSEQDDAGSYARDLDSASRADACIEAFRSLNYVIPKDPVDKGGRS